LNYHGFFAKTVHVNHLEILSSLRHNVDTHLQACDCMRGYLLMALLPVVGPWTLFRFLDLLSSR
jgi:hypothetical protein